MNQIGNKVFTPTTMTESVSFLRGVFNMLTKTRAREIACLEDDFMQRDYERFNFSYNLMKKSNFSEENQYAFFKMLSNFPYNNKPFIPFPKLEYIKSKEFPISKLGLFFGGTGRSALDSLGMSKTIHPSMIFRVNEYVYATVFFDCLDTGKLGVNLFVDGPGYFDTEGGLHGHGQQATNWFDKIKAQMFNTSPGSMADNSQKMHEAIGVFEDALDPEFEIVGDAYSRGSVALASLDVSSFRPKKVIYKLRDPVAGAMDQTAIMVNGVNHLIVQYSMQNALPFFWATPVSSTTADGVSYVLTIGGHSSLAREDTFRFGNLAELAYGVHFEHRPGHLVQMTEAEAIELLKALQEDTNRGLETGTVMNRFGEIKLAIENTIRDAKRM